jgi:hypothetical protein
MSPVAPYAGLGVPFLVAAQTNGDFTRSVTVPLTTAAGWSVTSTVPGIRSQIDRLPERIPSDVLFVFTTTVHWQVALFEDCADASPLLSRCSWLDLARRDLRTGWPTSKRTRSTAHRRSTPTDRGWS